MGKFGEINSADTRSGKFPLVPMGAERRVLRARTPEQGPQSALAEFYNITPVIMNITPVIINITPMICFNPRRDCRRILNFCMGS